MAKNAAFVYNLVYHPWPWQVSMENVMRGAYHPEAVSDWLNPLSLGTMSASAYIDYLA